MIAFILLLVALAHYGASSLHGSGMLPRGAFAYAPKGSPRSKWKYPVPSKSQARAVHLSEADRYRLHRGSLRAAGNPRSKMSYRTVAAASKRHGSPIASLNRAARGSAGKAVRSRAHQMARQDVGKTSRGTSSYHGLARVGANRRIRAGSAGRSRGGRGRR